MLFFKRSGHPGEAYGFISDMYFNQDALTLGSSLLPMVKKSVQAAKHSAFYETEEKVFTAIQNAFFLPPEKEILLE